MESNEATVRQSNRLINFSPAKMGLREKRLFLSILAMISPTDDDFREYRVNLGDILLASGTNDPIMYSKAKALASRLMSRQVFHETVNEEGKRIFEGFQLLSRVRYKEGDGYFTAWIDPAMREFLLGLKRDFTVYGLEDALKLRSLSGLRLYELLAQFRSTGWRKFSLEQFRHLMGLIDYDENGDPLPTRYPGYAQLKKNLIDRAIQDINTRKTALTVHDVEEIKRGRKVVALCFRFSFDIPVRLAIPTPAPPRREKSANNTVVEKAAPALPMVDAVEEERKAKEYAQARENLIIRWEALSLEERDFYLERARRLLDRDDVVIPDYVKSRAMQEKALEILSGE